MDFIQSVLSLLSQLGLNVGVLLGIFGVVSFSELVKKADPKQVLKPFYAFLPLVFAILAAFIVGDHPYSFQGLAKTWFVISGFAILLYDAIIKKVKDVLSSRKEGTPEEEPATPEPSKPEEPSEPHS